MMCDACQRLGIHRPRTKSLDVEKANMEYVKQRKHKKSQQRRIIRRLLNLLGKILKEIRRMMREHNEQEVLSVREQSTLGIITKVYRQQKNHFDSNAPRERIPDRIVSTSKPYVRPIVRGKEVKNVEFGAKCNNIQVDGISFIEKLSFNAFNEGTRLGHCIKMHKRLFGVDAKKIGGDTGLCRHSQQGPLQGTGHTDIIRQAWPSISREEEGGRLCPPGTGKSQGHSDGRLVRNTERALRHAQDQGQEEENRDPVHLLRHPHSERRPPGGASGRAARDQGGIRDI